MEVEIEIWEGRLRVAWTYSENLHRRETVERLATGYLASLRSLIAHCLAPGAGGYTPSDFPLARLDQGTLDRLLAATGPVEDVYPLAPLQHGMLPGDRFIVQGYGAFRIPAD